MEIPTVVIGSKTEIVQAGESIPEKPNGEPEASKPQEQDEDIDKSSRPEELNGGIKESSNLEELNKQDEDSKPQEQDVDIDKSSRPEELNGGIKESNNLEELNKQDEDSKPQEQDVDIDKSSRPEGLNGGIKESNNLEELNKQDEDSKPQGNGDHIEEVKPEEPSEVVGESNEIPELEEGAEKSKPLVTDEPTLASIPDSISIQESKTDDLGSALPEQTEDSKPQDLEEKTEEQIESSRSSIKRISSVSSSTESQRKYVKKKKKKTESINTESKKYPYNRLVTTENQSYGRVPLQRSLSPPLKPKMVDKAIQCNKLLMRRLPLPGTVPPQRNLISKVSPPGPREDKGTQKRDEDTSIAQVSPSKSSSPIWCKGNENLSKGIMRKSSGNIRRSGSLNKGTRSRSPKRVAVRSVSPTFSQTSKKGKSKSPNVVYNLYLNTCDGLQGIDQPHLMGICCKESIGWPGLSRACRIFSNLKSGRLHVSKLHHVLDMLGILVTSEEMYQTLCLVKTDESCMLNCTEFLEVVNRTSPFAETDALQNTLRAFRKIKKGMVSVDDLPSVLRDLEVHLCMNEIQTALENTRLSKNKTVDLLEFLLTARDLQKSLEEEDDARAFINSSSASTVSS